MVIVVEISKCNNGLQACGVKYYGWWFFLEAIKKMKAISGENSVLTLK